MGLGVCVGTRYWKGTASAVPYITPPSPALATPDEPSRNHSNLGRPSPLVISTEAKRSGEICGSAALSWRCFSTEGSWAFGPPKVMKNGCYSATTLPGRTAHPFVISTEAYPDFLLLAASDDHVCGSP